MNILFILHRSYGHLNASIGIIKLLVKSGHSVTIVSTNLIESQLKKLNFNYELVSFMPFGCGYEDVIAKENKFSYLANLKLRLMDSLYLKRKEQLDKILIKIQPKVILLDLIYNTDVVLLYEYINFSGAKLIYVSSMISLERTPTTPPPDCPHIPESQSQVEKYWEAYNKNKLKRNRSKKFKFLSFDDLSILQDRIELLKDFSSKYPYVHKNIGGNGKFDNIPQLILAPKEFEFQPFLPNPNQYYVGFQFHLRDETYAANYNKIMQLIADNKKIGNKIIFCSFGSIYHFYQEFIVLLIKKIFEAIYGIDKTFLIVSLDENIARNFSIREDKISIFDYVPQLSVLDHCSVFISHGGLNSIKESIYKKVPILAFPLNPDWDQNGNSARVAYHQIGLKGNIEGTTVNEIRNQLIYLINNELSFKEKLEEFRQVDQRYDEDFFFKTFIKIIKPDITQD